MPASAQARWKSRDCACHSNSAPVQAAYVYGLIGETLRAHGLTPADVAQQTLCLCDMADQSAVEAAAMRFFGAAGMPATAVVPITGASPFTETLLEIEFIAGPRA